MNQNVPNQTVGVMPSMWMEDEIDLREYIAVLIKYWRWIVAASVLAAVVAFVVSSFLPRTYEATASVLMTNPRKRITKVRWLGWLPVEKLPERCLSRIGIRCLRKFKMWQIC